MMKIRRVQGQSFGMKGKHHLEEVKRKMSFSHRGKFFTEEHKKNISKANKGKIRSEKIRERMSEVMRGKSLTEKTKKKISETLKGGHRSEETKKKMSEAHKGKSKKPFSEEHKEKLSKTKKGKKNPNWRGGVSFLPYPSTFNRELKQFIKNRDNDECQNPFCDHKSKRLTIHHIDHDKDNCSQFNLITLCNSCNGKANNKHRWQRLYKKIIWSKYE